MNRPQVAVDLETEESLASIRELLSQDFPEVLNSSPSSEALKVQEQRVFTSQTIPQDDTLELRDEIEENNIIFLKKKEEMFMSDISTAAGKNPEEMQLDTLELTPENEAIETPVAPSVEISIPEAPAEASAPQAEQQIQPLTGESSPELSLQDPEGLASHILENLKMEEQTPQEQGLSEDPFPGFPAEPLQETFSPAPQSQEASPTPQPQEVSPSAPQPQAAAPEPQPKPAPASAEEIAIMSPEAVQDALSAFAGLQQLNQNMQDSLQKGTFGKKTADELLQEILRPILKEWLDAHLPSLVKWLVTEQIERVMQQYNTQKK